MGQISITFGAYLAEEKKYATAPLKDDIWDECSEEYQH